MKLFICEICGDAYIGEDKPTGCPFCGARANFIKSGDEAKSIVNENIAVSEEDKKNLLETLNLETRANAIYLCMAGKTKVYKIKAMYKRLAKVELEHAVIVTKILKMDMPEINSETCAEEDGENFEKTIELEDHAADLYQRFSKKTQEKNIKILFTALFQVEKSHIELIDNLPKDGVFSSTERFGK